ncbi:hypothetical protein [Nostoc sp. ChiQUE01b]|uniref:hypothetical protein n=1 Tax=Nostoc sp. ChiQUE01b TaxID=3075376 RepID=UPI002AD59712|nr:hypothetical protein [Nostoc sp. ChiQUE01b]MDZ8258457.1 hypothetical protein [Nostoc sp. ChiQUE01b]
MGKLILPNLQGKQMGQVIVTLTVTNRIDRVLAQRGFISSSDTRKGSNYRMDSSTGTAIFTLNVLTAK